MRGRIHARGITLGGSRAALRTSKKRKPQRFALRSTTSRNVAPDSFKRRE